ncbi:MAG: hypothetical protein ABUS57_14315 [Pseudomonadota bacterium]
MSSIVSTCRRLAPDHFEPEAVLDPQEQRRLRGHLEQIDYAAFAANRETLEKMVGGAVTLAQFQRMAVAAALARGRWVAAAMAIAQTTQPTAVQIAQLEMLRKTFEEMTEAYEGLRRMVERGYLHYQAKA